MEILAANGWKGVRVHQQLDPVAAFPASPELDAGGGQAQSLAVELRKQGPKPQPHAVMVVKRAVRTSRSRPPPRRPAIVKHDAPHMGGPQIERARTVLGVHAKQVPSDELAAEVSDPDRPRSGVGRFGARNIWGVSQLMLGKFEKAIEAFDRQ